MEYCKCWIYGIRNKVNGKMYIGKTVNYIRRKYQHFMLDEKCCILKRAFERYGKDSFEMFPILHFTAINKKVANKVLNWLETYYIQKYNTFNDGYNATLGGEGQVGRIISEDTKNKMRDSQLEYYRNNYIQNRNFKKKKVLQYSKEGNFIREYSSASDAALCVIGSRKRATDIIHAIKNPFEKVYNFYWRYKTGSSNDSKIAIEYNPIHAVYYYTKDNVLIGIYPNKQTASKETGASITAIKSSLLRNPTFHKTNYWSKNKVS